MKKRSKMIIGVVIVFLLFLVFIPIGGSRFIEGYFIPFDYTVHWSYVEINKYTGDAEQVKIPSFLWGRPVKKISSKGAEGAFEEQDRLKSIMISNTVEIIESDAFLRCRGLEEISFGKNVKEICPDAFAGCTSIRSISFPESMDKIDGYAFEGCTALEEVIVNEGLREIGTAAFKDCTNLSDINIPKSVQSVEKLSFDNTAWIDKQEDEFLIVGDGVMLSYQGKSQEVVVPDGVKYIGRDAFYQKNFIEKITVPESVENISVEAFTESFNIKEIEIQGKQTQLTTQKSAGTNLENMKHIMFSIPRDAAIIEGLKSWGCQYRTE